VRSSVSRVVFAVAVLGLALATVLAGAACGETGEYVNDDHGFAITVDPRFSQVNEGDRGNGTWSVVFADPGGAQAGGRYLDAVVVSVTDVGEPMTAESIESQRAALEAAGTTAVSALGDEPHVWPASAATINGVPGIVLPFSVSIGGVPVFGNDYLLFSGSKLYSVVLMSSQSHWQANREAHENALRSFRVQ
jgi:hypothetical protein